MPAIPGIPTRVLVAPGSFTATMSAGAVAEALGRGLVAAGARVDLCPVADGGEGTLAVLAPSLGARLVEASAQGPRGRKLAATFGFVPGGRGRPALGIVEVAASSLRPMAGADGDPIAASTFGTGELILAAAREGAEVVYVAGGGCARTDGGAGAIRAIRGGGGLGRTRLVVLCDVRTRGPMTGAPGRLSGGPWSALRAEVVSGAGFVLDALGFDARMRAARAVVAGQGRLDGHSLAGQAVSEVATRCRQSGVPCYAVAGTSQLDGFGMRILDLQGVLEAGTPAALERAGQTLARVISV